MKEALLPDVELFIFRHGESEWNAGNIKGPHVIGGRSNETPLSEIGEEQSKSLGRYLLRENLIPDQVYSSPAVRALSTCQLTLAELGLDIEIKVDDALQELDQGEWVGQTREEVYTEAVLTDMSQLDKDFRPPGGESIREVGIRKYNWAETKFADIAIPQRVFVFGHGMATRSLAAHLHGWSREKTVSGITDNTSMSLFKRNGSEWGLVYLGRMPE